MGGPAGKRRALWPQLRATSHRRHVPRPHHPGGRLPRIPKLYRQRWWRRGSAARQSPLGKTWDVACPGSKPCSLEPSHLLGSASSSMKWGRCELDEVHTLWLWRVTRNPDHRISTRHRGTFGSPGYRTCLWSPCQVPGARRQAPGGGTGKRS